MLNAHAWHEGEKTSSRPFEGPVSVLPCAEKGLNYISLSHCKTFSCVTYLRNSSISNNIELVAFDRQTSLLALNTHKCEATHVLLWNKGIVSLGKLREWVLYGLCAGDWSLAGRRLQIKAFLQWASVPAYKPQATEFCITVLGTKALSFCSNQHCSPGTGDCLLATTLLAPRAMSSHPESRKGF
jgi:hypothetical protein